MLSCSSVTMSLTICIKDILLKDFAICFLFKPYASVWTVHPLFLLPPNIISVLQSQLNCTSVPLRSYATSVGPQVARHGNWDVDPEGSEATSPRLATVVSCIHCSSYVACDIIFRYFYNWPTVSGPTRSNI